MIINDKIRKMSDSEKIVYFLQKIQENGHNRSGEEMLKEITKIIAGTPLDQVIDKFGLKGKIVEGTKDKPTTLSIELPNGATFDIEVNIQDKKDFIDPQPVEPQPIRPLLSPEEIEEIKNIHE